MMKIARVLLLLVTGSSCVGSAWSSKEVNDDNVYYSEVWDDNKDPFLVANQIKSPLPISYLNPDDLPDSFSWGNVGGISYLTKSLNQHIPQYCGSCWAHATLSSLADRIKIARNATGDDINLSIQYILNCGSEAGSCHGGSMNRLHQFIHETGFVPYDTCQPYIACSSDSDVGFCPHVDTTCTPMNTCRTCTHETLECYDINVFPNATIAEYGTYGSAETDNIDTIKAEIFARGPVTAGIFGHVLGDYRGGIFDDKNASKHSTHAVSIVGWGTDTPTNEQYWIVRNSWGQYWGEMGYFKVLMGSNVIGIESHISWATPGEFTVLNFPCHEDGSNCKPQTQHFVDPSMDQSAMKRRLKMTKI